MAPLWAPDLRPKWGEPGNLRRARDLAPTQPALSNLGAWWSTMGPMLLRKLLRYASVSAISTVTALVVLGVLVAGAGMSAGWANVVATAVGTVPSFELNRRWVWEKGGRPALRAEVVPFVVLSFAGLVLSTLAVHEAAGWAAGQQLPTWARTVVDEVSHVAAFGSLWALQYVLLDRVLFRRHRAPAVGGAR
jgi:putative flippase GtrA